jgi:hypothetical protein
MVVGPSIQSDLRARAHTRLDVAAPNRRAHHAGRGAAKYSLAHRAKLTYTATIVANIITRIPAPLGDTTGPGTPSPYLPSIPGFVRHLSSLTGPTTPVALSVGTLRRGRGQQRGNHMSPTGRACPTTKRRSLHPGLLLTADAAA